MIADVNRNVRLDAVDRLASVTGISRVRGGLGLVRRVPARAETEQAPEEQRRERRTEESQRRSTPDSPGSIPSMWRRTQSRATWEERILIHSRVPHSL